MVVAVALKRVQLMHGVTVTSSITKQGNSWYATFSVRPPKPVTKAKSFRFSYSRFCNSPEEAETWIEQAAAEAVKPLKSFR